MAIIEAFALSGLFLEQSVSTNIKIVHAENNLVLTDTLGQNYKVQELQSFLHLRHLLTVNKILNVDVQSTLVLTQESKHRVFIVHAENFIFLQQEAQHRDKWPRVVSHLNLQQSVSYVLAKGINQKLTLTQSVTVNIVRNISVSNALTLTSGLTGFVPSYYWTSFPITVEEP